MTNTAKISMFSPAYLDFSTYDAVDEDFFTINYNFSGIGGKAVLFVKVFDYKFEPFIMIMDDEGKYDYKLDYEFSPEELSVIQMDLMTFLYLRETCNEEVAASELNAQMAALRG